MKTIILVASLSACSVFQDPKVYKEAEDLVEVVIEDLVSEPAKEPILNE